MTRCRHLPKVWGDRFDLASLFLLFLAAFDILLVFLPFWVAVVPACMAAHAVMIGLDYVDDRLIRRAIKKDREQATLNEQ